MANFCPEATSLWNKAIFLLLVFGALRIEAHPIPVQSDKTGIIDRLGQRSIVAFCHRNRLEPHLVYARDKEKLIYNDAHLSAMNLLYEFATGTGPVGTYWYEYHPYTQVIRDGIGIRHVCKWYLSMQSAQTFLPAANIRYQASATVNPFRPSTWYFAFEQNIKLLQDKNYPQFILGSFHVRVDTLGGDEFRFTLKNKMSRKSLFIGLGPRVQRPKPLGTTFQNISFVLTRDEIKERAERIKNKKAG